MKNIESPQPYYDQGGVTIYHGDNREVLLTLPDSSVDAVIADPPYGISFMNKRWDYDIPTVGQWEECLRVLKPGGHMLVFCGTRTQHRMAVNVEDAGFEIRDTIAWLYGSGFPKSLDVSKAIDKAAGAERERYERGAFGASFSDDGGTTYGTAIVNTPITDAAKQWDGWGTALKPAMELITVARKPLDGTVAANVQEHGTGGLNIDGSRIRYVNDRDKKANSSRPGRGDSSGNHDANLPSLSKDWGRWEGGKGRWPANVIHDGSEEVIDLFPDTGLSGVAVKDSGSAARFFYTAKAGKIDRDGTKHPTVKPIALMRYLVRLVCPEGGIVLDPWNGSGTTTYAARVEQRKAIGIEQEKEFVDDSVKRLAQGVFDFSA